MFVGINNANTLKLRKLKTLQLKMCISCSCFTHFCPLIVQKVTKKEKKSYRISFLEYLRPKPENTEIRNELDATNDGLLASIDLLEKEFGALMDKNQTSEEELKTTKCEAAVLKAKKSCFERYCQAVKCKNIPPPNSANLNPSQIRTHQLISQPMMFPHFHCILIQISL